MTVTSLTYLKFSNYHQCSLNETWSSNKHFNTHMFSSVNTSSSLRFTYVPACVELEYLLQRFHQSFVITANVSGLTMFSRRVYGSPQTTNSVQPYRRGYSVSHVTDLLPHYTAYNQSRYFYFIIWGSSMIRHLNHLTHTYTHKNHTCAHTVHQLTMLTCPPAWTPPPPQKKKKISVQSFVFHLSFTNVNVYLVTIT
jgi:hypothetical protein